MPVLDRYAPIYPSDGGSVHFLRSGLRMGLAEGIEPVVPVLSAETFWSAKRW